MSIREKNRRLHAPHTRPSPWRSARLPALLCFGVLGALQGACECTIKNGWEIVCNPGEPYDGTSPTRVCVHKAISEDGMSKSVMREACAQELDEITGNSGVVEPSWFPDVDYLRWSNGDRVSCQLSEHEFPVESLGDEGSGNDEAGDDGTTDPNNAIQCVPLLEIEITDGDGSYQVPTPAALRPCAEPGWDEADELAACSAKCSEWKNGFPEYPTFVDDEDHGDCDDSNFAVVDTFDPACSANAMPGSILAAAVEIEFTDAFNSITEWGSGAIAYDDSGCVTGVPCEPYVLMTFSLPFTSFELADATRVTHDVEANGLRLSTLQPAQAVVDPTSGLLRIEEVELDFTADSMTVDAVPVGPLHLRDFLGPLDLTIDPTNGEVTLTGTLMRDGAQLDLVFVGDPSRPVSWPSG